MLKNLGDGIVSIFYSKYLKLILFLIICLLGYTTGLYICYKNVLEYLNIKKESKYSVGECYTYKRVEKECV